MDPRFPSQRHTMWTRSRITFIRARTGLPGDFTDERDGQWHAIWNAIQHHRHGVGTTAGSICSSPTGRGMAIAACNARRVSLLVGPNVWQTPNVITCCRRSRRIWCICSITIPRLLHITYGPAVTVPRSLPGCRNTTRLRHLNAWLIQTTVYDRLFRVRHYDNYTGVTPQISLTQSLNTPQAATIQLDGLQPIPLSLPSRGGK